jgi:hypothetical protein
MVMGHDCASGHRAGPPGLSILNLVHFVHWWFVCVYFFKYLLVLSIVLNLEFLLWSIVYATHSKFSIRYRWYAVRAHPGLEFLRMGNCLVFSIQNHYTISISETGTRCSRVR